MTQSSDPTGDEEMSGNEMSEEEIDQVLEASFPASDPPQWTLGSDHHANVSQEKDDDLKDD